MHHNQNHSTQISIQYDWKILTHSRNNISPHILCTTSSSVAWKWKSALSSNLAMHVRSRLLAACLYSATVSSNVDRWRHLFSPIGNNKKYKHHRKIEKMTTHGPNDVSPAKLRYRREHVHLDFVNLSPLTTLVFRRSQQMSTAQASWRFSLPNLSWCGLTLSPLLNVNKSFHMDMGKDYTSIELPRQPTVSIKWGKITPRCHSNDAI